MKIRRLHVRPTESGWEGPIHSKHTNFQGSLGWDAELDVSNTTFMWDSCQPRLPSSPQNVRDVGQNDGVTRAFRP
jgi:hypothetical protein